MRHVSEWEKMMGEYAQKYAATPPQISHSLPFCPAVPAVEAPLLLLCPLFHVPLSTSGPYGTYLKRLTRRLTHAMWCVWVCVCVCVCVYASGTSIVWGPTGTLRKRPNSRGERKEEGASPVTGTPACQHSRLRTRQTPRVTLAAKCSMPSRRDFLSW